MTKKELNQKVKDIFTKVFGDSKTLLSIKKEKRFTSLEYVITDKIAGPQVNFLVSVNLVVFSVNSIGDDFFCNSCNVKKWYEFITLIEE